MSKIGKVTMKRHVLENVVNKARKEGYDYGARNNKQHDRQIRMFEAGLDKLINRAQLEIAHAQQLRHPYIGWNSVINIVNALREDVYREDK